MAVICTGADQQSLCCPHKGAGETVRVEAFFPVPVTRRVAVVAVVAAALAAAVAVAAAIAGVFFPVLVYCSLNSCR